MIIYCHVERQQFQKNWRALLCFIVVWIDKTAESETWSLLRGVNEEWWKWLWRESLGITGYEGNHWLWRESLVIKGITGYEGNHWLSSPPYKQWVGCLCVQRCTKAVYSITAQACIYIKGIKSNKKPACSVHDNQTHQPPHNWSDHSRPPHNWSNHT